MLQSPRLFANIASGAIVAGGLPRLLTVATYSDLASIREIPAALSSQSGFWACALRPHEKLLALRLLAAGADNETVTLDFGLYPSLSDGPAPRTFGQTARGVFTLGAATEASMDKDPFTGLAVTSATFRHPDAVAWTWRDSDLQFQVKGEGTDQSRVLYLDVTAASLFVVAWQARSASCSRILLGGSAEGA